MLILSQDKTKLLNMKNVVKVEAKQIGGYGSKISIIATATTGAEDNLGGFETCNRAVEILTEISTEYGKYVRVEGGPLATMDAYVQPLMFEPPKVYKMPEV